MSHEIVTLQVGNYTNFVGTHWWNLQGSAFSFDPNEKSEISHGIMFREGLTLQGVQTYLPRTICLDIKGNLEPAEIDKGLYENAPNENQPTWGGAVSVYGTNVDSNSQEQTVKNLENSGCNALPSATNRPALWSDNVLTPLHPRSVHIFKDYSFNSETHRFSNFFDGIELVSSLNEMDEIEGRIRYFSEECDHLQGFHLLLDANNGFGGFATHIASYLEDEFKTKSVLAVPLFNLCREDQNHSRNMMLALNSFVCMEKLMSSCKCILPLSCFANIFPMKERISRSFPFLKYNEDVASDTSMILAAALETATMMYRHKNSTMGLFDYLNTFTVYGRRVAAMSTVLPFPVYQDRSIFETVLKLEPDIQLQTLTPSCNVMHNKDLARLAVIRGLPLNLKMRLEKLQPKNLNVKFERFEDLLNWYLQQMNFSHYSLLRQMETGLKLDSAYSQIFDDCITSSGTISTETRASGKGVDALPALSALHSSSDLNSFFQDLLHGVSETHVKNVRKQIFGSLEDDEFISMIENVRQFASCYTDG